MESCDIGGLGGLGIGGFGDKGDWGIGALGHHDTHFWHNDANFLHNDAHFLHHDTFILHFQPFLTNFYGFTLFSTVFDPIDCFFLLYFMQVGEGRLLAVCGIFFFQKSFFPR